MARSFLQLLKDRSAKRGLYDSPAYWDMKARTYQGLARSNWPSNSYNAEVHRRQMALVDELLGEVRGLAVADVGCGTGRTSLHLAERGARVTGWDFSPGAVEAARAEASARGLGASFEVGDVRVPPPADRQGAFDAVVVVGCLTLACPDRAALEQALRHVVALARPGGRVLFIEPIHSARLTARILRLGVEPWLEACSAAGLTLLARRGIFFVPARYALAFRDLPGGLVRRGFDLGEAALGRLGEPMSLADYKVLLFVRREGG